MTPEQEQHLNDITSTFSRNCNFKFRKGQAEHGGNLKDRDVLFDASEECIDLVTYIFTAIENRNKAVHLLRFALRDLAGSDETESARVKIEEAIALIDGRPPINQQTKES